MGRRWWQKEARRAQASDEIYQKDSSTNESDGLISDINTNNAVVIGEELSNDEVLSSALEVASLLEQEIAGFDNSQIANDSQAEEILEVDEVKVEGIAMVHNNFRSNNKKNKRR